MPIGQEVLESNSSKNLGEAIKGSPPEIPIESGFNLLITSLILEGNSEVNPDLR